jgi:hypothetical protein
VLFGGLVELVFEGDDVAGVLEHVLLHFVEDDALGEGLRVRAVPCP